MGLEANTGKLLRCLLATGVLTLLLYYVVRSEKERGRLIFIEDCILKTSTETTSFRFKVNMTTQIERAFQTMSMEVNEGTFKVHANADHKSNYPAHMFVAHMMTKTRVEHRGDTKSAQMQVERIVGGADDWIKYHSVIPKSLLQGHTLGIWQDTADLLDNALKSLSKEEGDRLVSVIGGTLGSGNPLAHPATVIAMIRPEFVTWVEEPEEDGDRKCYNVMLKPSLLLDDDTVTFEFVGIGIGLSALGTSKIKGTKVRSMYCINKHGLLEYVVTEATKDGPQGFHFRKTATIFDFNKPASFPVPKHDDCIQEGDGPQHGCAWKSGASS